MATQVANVSRDVNMLSLANGRRREWLTEAATVSEDPGGLDANAVRNMLAQFDVVRGQSKIEYTDASGKLCSMDDGRFTPWINVHTGRVYRHTKPGAELHQYTDLYDNLRAAIDVPGLAIVSAGAWAFGASAYVQFETPNDVVRGQSGIELAPFIGWTTSHDGSLPTTIGDGVTAIICENTFAAFTSEAAKSGMRVRQTKHSLSRITPQAIREALDLGYEHAATIASMIDTAAEFTVTDAMLSRFVESMYPMPKDGKGYVGAVERNRELFTSTFRANPMVKPWTGTAFGLIQAVNVIEQHEAPIRATVDDFTGKTAKSNRFMRNVRSWAEGDVDAVNTNALDVLNNVLSGMGKRKLSLIPA